MVLENIYKEMTRALSRDEIVACAKRNGEQPFGYVIDYIKDMYLVPKTEGWDTAKAVCKFFSL